MKAFLGEVNEMRAAEDIEEEDALSSEGPAPMERSYNETKKHGRLKSNFKVGG